LYGDDIIAVQELYEKKITVTKAESPGKVIPCPIIDQYVDVLYQHFPYLSQYDFKMVLDCGNGTVGPVLKKLVEKMEWKDVHLLNAEVDGTFPNHEADPTVKKNMLQLITELKNRSGYFGIGFDGDGDRMIGVTDQGELILGDVMLALFAQDMLQEERDDKVSIVYDVKSSSLVEEVVERGNGTALVSRTGCSFIQEKMDESGALLGGELSGHYFFRDRHQGYDDALYAMLRLFDVLVKQRASMTELLAKLPQKHASLEIRIPCDDLQKELIVTKIGDHLRDGGWKISKVDGVRAERASGWGLLRASHTQPAVSFRCEAQTEKDVCMIKDEFSKALKLHICPTIIDQHLL
jgi:phosphomannomutase